jgi:hypothetical protein
MQVSTVPRFALLRLVCLGVLLGGAPVGFDFAPGQGLFGFSAPMAWASGKDEDDDEDSGNGGNSGPGGGGNSGPGGGGNSGPGGGDDDDFDEPRQSPAQSTSSDGQVWMVAWVRVSGSDIEVQYTDGWSERIDGERYLLIDERGRVAIDRPLRRTDRDRLAPLFR